ncbi:hypothetical protein [Brevibacterium spongiae]|uniref:Uncharacterized protein n=1 Tax=Brevibacterium spongiae TaxID=2909672 RepID=A0ABY5SRQ5_9MICO|nr:hypothetical protein [Brevibacterium spongiae]UVI37227.1 hypothetical protein L1F31_06135 [Brevibacterium spongiae]
MSVDRALIESLIVTAGSAPSAHNAQPWLPEILSCAATAAEVLVAVDPARTLPHGDPRSEDLHLSMGCWVESLSIAAAEAGVAVESLTVRGRGPALTIRLRLRPIDAAAAGSGSETAEPDSEASAALGRSTPERTGAWPRFTVADLRHRQVDRGRLDPADTEFTEALTCCREALSGAPVRLVEVPDQLWRGWARRAGLHSYGDSAVFAETLHWLRFDESDPRYRRDGLNAECLRIPRLAARAAALLDRPKLHPWITAATAAVLAPAALLGRLRAPDVPVGGRSGERPAGQQSAAREEASPRRRPHHVLLAVAGDRGLTPADEVTLGRLLLRIWLVLDRFGLRVDVHSEIKDSPDTRSRARAYLRERTPRSAEAGAEEAGAEDGTEPVIDRPIAAFTVGRSATAVPRSARLSPDSGPHTPLR